MLSDEDGRVDGISIGNDLATCGAVIMATGGFGANPEMIENITRRLQQPETGAGISAVMVPRATALHLGNQ